MFCGFQNPQAKGVDKLLGDSLSENPDNLIYRFNQEILKAKLLSGKYATIHVFKIIKLKLNEHHFYFLISAS